MEEKKTKNHFQKFLAWGCLSSLGLLIILFIIIAATLSSCEAEKSEPPEFIKDAEKKVIEKEEKLASRKKLFSEEKKTYDIDETIKSIFSIETALKTSGNFKDLTPLILQKDSDMAAPEVLELKYRFFNLYKKLIESRDDLEEMDSIYNITTGTLIDMFSTVKFPSFSVDRDQAQRIWVKRLQESDLRADIKKRLSGYQDEMIDFYFDFMKVSSKYVKEWDKLCTVRDRAYLAIYEGNIDAAIKNAEAAVKLAPHEKEAHLLLAMSLIERGLEQDTTTAESLVDDFLKENRGQNAPAHLLKGVINFKKKDFENAVLDFDQAATYFPKQQEILLDRLNLYRRRNFLNKSKEGRMIVNMYRGIMTGSGYFSPDFQKARIHLAEGEDSKAKRKVFDHFFRRRLQGQWDKVLTDFQYANTSLKTGLFNISDDVDLNLEIDSAYFTNSVIVDVKNNSKTDIHNVTILLCVRFTDMFKGDYISFPVGETVATLKAGESINIGRKNITETTELKLGSKKEFKDIIEYAAVLISDEIITWVEAKEVGEVKPSKEDKLNYRKKEKTESKDSDTEEETSTKEKIKKAVKDIITDKVSDTINETIDKMTD